MYWNSNMYKSKLPRGIKPFGGANKTLFYFSTPEVYLLICFEIIKDLISFFYNVSLSLYNNH